MHCDSYSSCTHRKLKDKIKAQVHFNLTMTSGYHDNTHHMTPNHMAGERIVTGTSLFSHCFQINEQPAVIRYV